MARVEAPLETKISSLVNPLPIAQRILTPARYLLFLLIRSVLTPTIPQINKIKSLPSTPSTPICIFLLILAVVQTPVVKLYISGII